MTRGNGASKKIRNNRLKKSTYIRREFGLLGMVIVPAQVMLATKSKEGEQWIGPSCCFRFLKRICNIWKI
jgi:hypothetical protein